MSEGKGTNFFDKLKKDKKTRFEFIMAIWSGIIGIALVIGLFFVGKTFFFGKKVVDSGDLEEKPAVVTEQAVEAEETPAPYDSAIVSGNEEDFEDDEEDVDDNLKDAKVAYATTVVNLRSEAALTADVIAKLQTGDKVTIIEYGKEWTKVEINGTQGYVSTIYLSTKKPAEEPTATPAPRTTSAPKATATPKPTKRPKATKKPKATRTPATHSPSHTPQATQAPLETVAPEPTKVPEPTKAPEPTKVPEPTKAPEPTKEPEPEKTPDQSSAQEG